MLEGPKLNTMVDVSTLKSLVSELFIETNHRYVDLLCTSMDTGIYDFGPWQYFDGSIPHMAFKFRAADASDWCISPEKRTLGSSLNIDDPRVICIGTGQGSIDWWWRSDSGSKLMGTSPWCDMSVPTSHERHWQLSPLQRRSQSTSGPGGNG